MINHTITQEDLDLNPELAGKVAVGDVVELGPPVPKAGEGEGSGESAGE